MGISRSTYYYKSKGDKPVLHNGKVAGFKRKEETNVDEIVKIITGGFLVS